MPCYKAHHMHHDFIPKSINCIAYDEDNKKLAVARFDEEGCQIEVWSFLNDCWMFEKILPVVASVEDMVWHGTMLLVAGLEGNLIPFDVAKACIRDSVSCNFGPIWCLAANKNLIAAGTEEGCVVLFEALSDSVVYKQAVAKQPGRILCISWYKADIIVTGGTDVRVFETSSGRCVQRIAVGKQVCLWSLVVSRDFTIITGDSSGHTSFWYGEPGQVSHCKRYRSHEADIHSLSLNHAHNVVAVAGVDGITLFKLLTPSNKNTPSAPLPSSSSSSSPSWVMAGKRNYHSNDVRCVRFISGKMLASAGLDCQVIVSEKKKKLTTISAHHQRSMVKVARGSRCILHEYDKRLELWMADKAFCDEEDTSKFREDLAAEHTKLTEFKSHSAIVCSAISDDSRFVAYSNQKATHVFRTVICSKHFPPSIRVHHMQLPSHLRSSPSSLITASSHPTIFATLSQGNLLTFLVPDDGGDGDDCRGGGGGGSGGGVRDGGSGNDSRVKSKKKLESSRLKVLSTVSLQEGASVRYMSFNCIGTLLHVAFLNLPIATIDVATAAVISSLPSHHKPPTSICTHPSRQHHLLVSYADGLIAEYDCHKAMLTRRSKVWSRKHHSEFLKHQHMFINRIIYDSSRPDWLILQHDSGFSLVDWSQLKQTDAKTSQLVKYVPTKSLFAVETTPRKRNLFLVEKCSLEMMSSYRPPFKKHKFGH